MRVLHTYHPPRAHPMVYAGLVVFAAVSATGSVENALRDGVPRLYAIYAAPFLATLLLFVAMLPSPVQIRDDGIAPSRPLALRWWRPFHAWSDVRAVYPCYYDVTGAFVSPFASSDGKVTQMGLAVERRDGATETVRFTPSRLALGVQESAGYTDALAAVHDAFGDRPLVPEAPSFTKAERERMLAEARKPFLPFFVIVLLLASAAPVLALLVKLGLGVAWALPLALAAPTAVVLRSWLQSRRRNALLNALAKSAEHARSGTAKPAPDAPGRAARPDGRRGPRPDAEAA